MIEINLLPGAATRAGRGRGFGVDTESLAALTETLGNRYVIAGTGTALIGLAALAGMYLFGVRQARAVAERESLAARDSARYASVLVARRRAETSRDSVYQQLAIIKSIDDSRYTWPHVLEAINLALPQYTWLTSVQQTSPVTSTAAPVGDTARKAPAGTGARPLDPAARARLARAHADSLFNGSAGSVAFRVVGQTVDIQALTQFMKALEASPFIRDVQLTRSDLVTSGTQQITEFQLEARTAVPPPAVLQTVPLSIAVH